MITLEKNGVYLKNGQIVESGRGLPAPEEARKGTMAYSILSAHNKGDDKKQRLQTGRYGGRAVCASKRKILVRGFFGGKGGEP